MEAGQTARARRQRAPGDFVAVQRFFEDKGWTDGLPIVPPTESLVSEMLTMTPFPPEEELGKMEPLNGTVTIEKIAANAVMAGCEPCYFPVVVAAMRAIMQPQFHVGSTACTTGGAAPVIVVSGPIASEIGINSATSCFGGNVKANATIGRAVRLTMRNIGGAKPGGMEKSTLGWPGKMSMCYAEAEERTPWAPFRVSQGFSTDQSAVSVLAVRGLIGVTEGAQDNGLGVLETIAASMRMVGTPAYYQDKAPVIVSFGPEHAREIADAGFSTREKVQGYLFEHCRLPVKTLRGRGYDGSFWPEAIDPNDDDALVPIVTKPSEFWVMVAGGDGRHSAWMPAWNVCEGASEPIIGIKQRQ